MKNNLRIGIRAVLTILLSVMMAAGGVLPFSVQDLYAESGSTSFNSREYDGVLIFYQDGDRSKPAYCLNEQNFTPTGQGFSDYKSISGPQDLETYLGYLNAGGGGSTSRVRDGAGQMIPKIVYLGYPNDAAGLQTKHGLTDDQFQTMTQTAIWYYSDSYSTTSVDGKSNVILDYLNEHASEVTVPSDLEIQVWNGIVTNYTKKYQNMLVVSKKSAPMDDDTGKGKLTIKKTVAGDGADQNLNFSFKVTLPNGTFYYSGSKSGTIKNGDTITLKHGESVTINDIPAGSEYKVEEQSVPANWNKSDSGNTTGTITKDGNAEVTFTNTYNKPSETVTAIDLNFQLKKTISGAGAPAIQDGWFQFMMEKVSYDPGDGASITVGTRYNNGNGVLRNPFIVKFKKAGVYTFRIKENTAYNHAAMAEQGISLNASAKTVKVTVTEQSGVLVPTVTVNGTEVNKTDDLVTQTGTVSGYQTGDYTNTYKSLEPVTASIKLKKGIDDYPDNSNFPQFRFTIENASGEANDGATIKNGARWSKPRDEHELWNPFNIEFSKEGTYKFTIKEDKTETGKNSNSDYTGMAFDATDRDITIEVENDNNVLKIKNVSGATDTGSWWMIGETFKNTYTPQNVSTKVQKKWLDESGREMTGWPSDVSGSVTLKVKYGTQEKTVTIDSSTTQPVEVTDFTPESGASFSVTEESVTGYTMVESSEDNGVFTVTNKKDNAAAIQTRIQLEKTINDFPAGRKYPSFKFVLEYLGSAQGVWLLNDTRWTNANSHKLNNPFVVEFSKAGTYNFMISERKTSADRDAGHDYTGVEFTAPNKSFTVTVENIEGQLRITSVTGSGATITQNGIITIGDKFENDYNAPKLGTTAKDAADNDTTLACEGGVKIKDVIKYENLQPETTYTIAPELHKKNEDGTDGGKVRYTSAVVEGTDGLSFTTPKSKTGSTCVSGEVTVVFTLDTSDLGGKEIVVFEDLQRNGATVATHSLIGAQSQTVSVEEMTYDIKISKTDLGGTEVAGAEMKLVVDDEEETLIEEWTSTGSSKEFTLDKGDYILKELVAPDGYAQVSTPMKFSVNENGSVTLKTTSVDSGGEFYIKEGTENHIILADDAAYDIYISKKVLGGDEVAGATMKLTGGPDNLTAQWISEGRSEHFLVRAGDYVLTEEVAPKGLKKVTTEIKFTVKKDGTVDLKTATVNNGGKISVQEIDGVKNSIVLEDAPETPKLIKTVNGGKSTTMKSEKDTVEFKLTSTVPYGVKEFVFKDKLPAPLLYVEDSINATLGGQDLIQYNPDKGWFGYTATSDTDVVVEVLSPVVEGVEGPSNIPPEEAWGKEVVVTFKCKIDPDADLSDFKDPVVNVANVIVDGVTYTDTGDNKASVLGIYDLADDDDARGANTGDDAPIGWAVVGLISAALALDLMRRRRMSN